MKKVILIHGWGGSPTSEPWLIWLKEECEKRNLEFNAPEMPDTESPKMDEWISKIESLNLELDEESYFIGYSVGCQTIIRYLSKLDNPKLGGIIFVAPWTKLDEKSIEEEGEESVEIVKSWISVPINYKNAKNSTNNILAIFSDNDPYVPVSEADTFKEKLGAEIIIKNNKRHFNYNKELNEIMEFIER